MPEDSATGKTCFCNFGTETWKRYINGAAEMAFVLRYYTKEDVYHSNIKNSIA
jgi:hypothetical protein